MSLGCVTGIAMLGVAGQVELTFQTCFLAALVAISVGTVGGAGIAGWERLASMRARLKWPRDLAVAMLAGVVSSIIAGMVLAFALGLR